MASDPVISVGSLKEKIALIKDLGVIGGVILTLAAIGWPEYGVLDKVAKFIATTQARYEAHAERTSAELKEHIKEDKAERKAMAADHAKAADKFIATIAEQRETFSKTINDNTRATSDLTAELRKNRIILSTRQAQPEKAGAPGG